MANQLNVSRACFNERCEEDTVFWLTEEPSPHQPSSYEIHNETCAHCGHTLTPDEYSIIVEMVIALQRQALQNSKRDADYAKGHHT